jgi:hypothetical protein
MNPSLKSGKDAAVKETEMLYAYDFLLSLCWQEFCKDVSELSVSHVPHEYDKTSLCWLNSL